MGSFGGTDSNRDASLRHRKPYEKLKELTRGHRITPEQMQKFVETLEIPAEAKAQLLALTPRSYTGYAEQLARDI